MFPEMADEIQTVCWSKRTVPQHHELFRVRKSRPFVLQLALTALKPLFINQFTIMCMRQCCVELCKQHVHDCGGNGGATTQEDIVN